MQEQLYYKACLCTYCGDNYNGWQRQKNAVGIQNIIEQALSKIYDSTILIAGSGRTDTQVHALGQVFNFSANKFFINENLMRALNAILPKDIAILDIIDVKKDFHSGKSIKSKTYLYKIVNSPIHNPFLINRALWIRSKIDMEKLVKKTKKENTIRTINFIKAENNGENISIFINASGFLHNMVRIIIGSSLKILKDNIHDDYILEIFEKKDRRAAGPTAPAYGLYQYAAYYNNDNIAGLKGIPEKYRI